MSSPVIRSVLALAVWAAVSGRPLRAADSDGAPAAFDLATLDRARERIEAVYSRLNIRFRYAEIYRSAKNVGEGQAATNDGRVLLHVFRTQEQGTGEAGSGPRPYESVKIANPARSFNLKRNSRFGAYRLEPFFTYQDALWSIRDEAKLAFAPYCYNSALLTNFLRSSTIGFVGASTEGQGPEELTTLRFVEQLTGKLSFTFASGRSWVLVGYDLRWQFATGEVPIHRGKISYDGEVDGIPLVSRAVYSLAYEQPGQRVPKPESLDVYVVESISTDPLPPEDFTLAAFGVPKPGSKTESGEGWFLLASVAILAIFGLGCFGLRRIVAAA